MTSECWIPGDMTHWMISTNKPLFTKLSIYRLHSPQLAQTKTTAKERFSKRSGLFGYGSRQKIFPSLTIWHWRRSIVTANLQEVKQRIPNVSLFDDAHKTILLTVISASESHGENIQTSYTAENRCRTNSVSKGCFYHWATLLPGLKPG